MNIRTTAPQNMSENVMKHSVRSFSEDGKETISYTRFDYGDTTRYQLVIYTAAAEYVFSGTDRTAVYTAARCAVADPHRLKPSFVSVDPVFGIQMFFRVKTPVADMAPAERAAFIKRTVAGHIASV